MLFRCSTSSRKLISYFNTLSVTWHYANNQTRALVWGVAPLLHMIYGQPNAAKAARNMSQIFQEIRVCGRCIFTRSLRNNPTLRYTDVMIFERL